MASPQVENGFTSLANELLEWIVRAPLNGSQFRLMFTLSRLLYGHKKTKDTISVTQFQQATGLHKQVIARELRDLNQRRYISAIGDVHHAKVYQIQKDYTLWDCGKVYTDWLTDHGTDRYTVPPQVYTDPLTEVYTDRSPFQRKKEKDTETHVSGTLRDRTLAKYKAVRDSGGNTVAVFGELFSNVLGSEPNWALLGRLSKELNNSGKLIDLIIEAGRRSISDDPTAYLAKMVKNYKAEGRPGRAGQADHNSPSKNKVVV